MKLVWNTRFAIYKKLVYKKPVLDCQRLTPLPPAVANWQHNIQEAL